MSDRIHPTEFPPIGSFTSPSDVSIYITRMRYDCTAAALHAMADEIKRQADGDMERGRFQLAAQLYGLHALLCAAARTTDRIWKLCEPHMRDE